MGRLPVKIVTAIESLFLLIEQIPGQVAGNRADPGPSRFLNGSREEQDSAVHRRGGLERTFSAKDRRDCASK